MPPSIDVLTSSSAADWPTVLMALKRPLPSPKVMVPKQSFETRRPVLPSVAYSIAFSFLESPKCLREKVSVADRIPAALLFVSLPLSLYRLHRVPPGGPVNERALAHSLDKKITRR